MMKPFRHGYAFFVRNTTRHTPLMLPLCFIALCNMDKKSWRYILLVNLAAFVLVALWEILSIWNAKDKFETDMAYYLHGIKFAVVIMIVIWLNHFLLIPFIYDKRKYVTYALSLLATIFLVSFIQGYANGWVSVSKMFFFLIYTTGTGMAVFLLRRNLRIQRENEEKEKLQKEMALNYLKQQVNPHFLFNALNSIYALSREQSPETPTVVMQLSELMRYQLESSKKDAVLLREELEFIENYLLLEEKRLSKRCTVEFSISGSPLEYTIAPMLLIPFVENAVKHGAQSTNEASTIEVSATIHEGRLHFNVHNSKPSQGAAAAGPGTGLENVKRRLQLVYPQAHRLQLEDTEREFRIDLTVDLKKSSI
jgi:sensor histidine kinase YesM